MRLFYFKDEPKTSLCYGGKTITKCILVKKLIYKDIFALVEVIKASVKTKENGENIYKMLNAWLRNSRSILAFMRKKIKDRKRETGRTMLGE